jgi:zinc D-Ala-D-Ala carboxypeptidase
LEECAKVSRQREKIVKSRTGWHKADQVKKIKIVMTMTAVALCISVAAGSTLLWIQVKHPFDHTSSSRAQVSSAAPVSSESDVLPTYDDKYNLIVVNSSTPLKSDFITSLVKYDGILVDEKIIPSLKKMIQDAKADGCALKLTGGYVDAKEQDKLFEAAVQNLMKSQGYTRVRAENQAQNTVGRGGYNENQTGMAVNFSADNLAANADFTATDQYKWLIKNCISYGFVLRYPDNKIVSTGMAFLPHHFRYVGGNNAVKMREYAMCLEEYAVYVHKQTANW